MTPPNRRNGRGEATLEQNGQDLSFCDSCNAVLTGPALFCSSCGQRVATSEPVEPVEQQKPRAARPKIQPRRRREPGKVTKPVKVPFATEPEADLFSMQVRLIHRFHDQAQRLDRSVTREERKIGSLLAQSRRPDLRPQLAAATERVFELEQSWEEIQRSYNRQSETVEEEFLGRMGGLQADFELTPELQSALKEELDAFMRTLEDVGDRISDLGQRMELRQVRQESRFLTLPGAGAMPVVFVLTVVCFSMGLSAFLGLRWGVSLPALAAVLAPPAIGLLSMGCLFLYRQSPPAPE